MQPPPHFCQHHSGGGVAFQAAGVIAAAQRPLLINADVSDLPGPAADAPVQPPAQQHARADAGGRFDVDQVAAAAQLAELPLGQRAQVGVVVHQHRGREARAVQHGSQRTRHVLAVPAGHVGGPDHLPGLHIDGAGNAHAHRRHLGRWHARLGQHLQHQAQQQGIGGGWSGADVVRLFTAGKYGAA